MKPLHLLFALLFLAASTDAFACSCLPPPPVPQAVAEATRVFHGEVVAVEDLGNFDQRVTFQVAEHFKGSPVDTIELVTSTTGAMCGYPFQMGAPYVVYADGSEGALTASSCTRTTLAIQPGSDLDALRALD